MICFFFVFLPTHIVIYKYIHNSREDFYTISVYRPDCMYLYNIHNLCTYSLLFSSQHVAATFRLLQSRYRSNFDEYRAQSALDSDRSQVIVVSICVKAGVLCVFSNVFAKKQRQLDPEIARMRELRKRKKAVERDSRTAGACKEAETD